MTTQFTSKNVRIWLFVAILLLAFTGRILNIDTESLWVDEGFSYWAIRHPELFSLLANDVHPPLYFVSLREWAGVSGITELALRYFSVLPSVLSVAAVYHVGRELVLLRGISRSDARWTLIPLLAALLLALADMENYIAQETRNYTWHVLWAIVSMWGFLRWLRTEKRGMLFAWVGASLLLVYTHYIGVCLLMVQGLYALLFVRGHQRLLAIVALGLVGILFAPWLLVVVSGQTTNVGTGFNVPSTLESLWNWRIEWFTGQWTLMMGLALLGVVAVNAGERLKLQLRPIAPGFLMLVWLVIPVVLAYILNFYTPILMDYRLTQITPAVALLVAFGLGTLRGQTLNFLVLVIVVYGVAIDDTPRPRPPWREVGQNAAQFAVPDDLALAHVTPSGDWQVMYYYERFMPEVERRSLRQWQLEDGETYATGLPALLENYPHVWFMHWSSDVSGFEALEATGHVQTAIMTEDWLGNDLNMYRFDVLPDDPITTYESNMVLQDAAIHADELRVDLWWSAEGDLAADYTVSAFLLDENGVLVAQDDAQPFLNQRPTTTWEAGEVIYDPHTLQLTNGDTLPPGTYTIGVKVYQWTPEGIIDQLTQDGEEFQIVGTITR